MTRSMTGYGRGESSPFEEAKWIVEIHAVNRKLLDINVHLPREWLKFDLDLRKWISKEIKRGQVTVKVFLYSEKAGMPFSNIYCEALAKAKEGWEEVASALGFEASKAIDFRFLVERTSSSDLSFHEEKVAASLKTAFELALAEFLEMREKEGKLLAEDLQTRFKILEERVTSIAKLMENAPKKYREKLLDRISEALETAEQDERVLKEITLYAEKVDVSEEITRLSAHLQQAKQFLQKKGESIGRALDFLTQEILRELNTLGSKAPLLEVIQSVLEGKSDLEKIREQVQNIE